MASAVAMPGSVESGRRAVELLERRGRMLRRIALRVSLCSDDADDALQRATVILLTKGDRVDPGRLTAWMAVVIRREALAVRRARERLLAAEPPSPQCERPGPAERAERAERVSAAARLLARLKPDERVALALQAQGHSYAEICELTRWSYTKTNRCLAEGRARLRQLGAMD
jgi:RNA polymerase sigma factor (sigma-70 family)